MKALNAFMKLFEAPQRSENKKLIFILIQLFKMHRAGRIKQNHIGKSQYVFSLNVCWHWKIFLIKDDSCLKAIIPFSFEIFLKFAYSKGLFLQ